jgi:16S rRNA (cytosine1402-N4)-methyltransferase
MDKKHVPVLCQEIIDNTYLGNTGIFVDGTLGLGGHALAILNGKPEVKKYIGFDVDNMAITLAKETLDNFKNVSYVNQNYSTASSYLQENNIPKVDSILLDLGVSSMQLDSQERGFSFRYDAPLNMRLDGGLTDTVKEYINSVDEEELYEVLLELGEDSYAYKITKNIISARAIKPIETTFELRDIVTSAYPLYKRHGKTHPATKTFQALRIVINSELTHINKALDTLPAKLSEGGKMMVISFHSLEDRLVKQKFKSLHESGEYTILTKKPLVPSKHELLLNPRSRSSKLRIIEKKYA